MTSIHVVDYSNRDDYASIMDDYFRRRHDVFVKEKGWRALHRDDGREIDRFDDEHATYILALEGGRVVGGSRLYPTVRPHMISEAFMHLVDRPLPRNRMTLEWTRYFVVRERRMGRTDCRLMASVHQYCLEEGITFLTGVAEMWWVPRWHQAGFTVRPLGLPQIIEGQPTMAVCISVSAETVATVSKLGGLKPANLVRNASTRSVDTLERDAA